MGGLVLETFALCLNVVVMETWGVASTLYWVVQHPLQSGGGIDGISIQCASIAR